MNKNIKIKKIEKLQYASIKSNFTHEEIKQAFGKLYMNLGFNIAGNPFLLIYNKFFTNKLNQYETCVPVKKEFTSKKNIDFKTIEKGTVLSYIHKGSYENFDSSYEFIQNYIESKKINIKYTIREIYTKGPGLFKGKEEDYLTEIQIYLDE